MLIDVIGDGDLTLDIHHSLLASTTDNIGGGFALASVSASLDGLVKSAVASASAGTDSMFNDGMISFTVSDIIGGATFLLLVDTLAEAKANVPAPAMAWLALLAAVFAGVSRHDGS